MRSSSPTLGDVIRQFGAALLAERGESMTPAQHAVLTALGRCQTAALGGHVYRCDNEACAAEHVAYNSCRNRHCPGCQGHKSAAWWQARARDLLPVPYFHVVFTLPEQVANLAFSNKRRLYGMLFQAAAQTLLEVARNPCRLGAAIGFVAVLHTWSQKLLHHPHIHFVVPGGGLSPEQSRWIACRDAFFLHVKVLSQVFRGKYLQLLDQAARAGELRFAGSTAPLAEPKRWTAFMRQMRRTKWVVYAKPPFGSPQQVLKYLARYTHRVAISNARIASVDEQTVTFLYRDRSDNSTRTMTLPGHEFLRRFLLHVLPKSFVRIRHYGLLANCVRRERLELCRQLLGDTTVTEPPEVPEPSDAADQPRLAPLCPTCRIGHLLVIAIVPPTPWTPRPRPPPGPIP